MLRCRDDLKISKEIGRAFASPATGVFQRVQRIVRVPDREPELLEQVGPTQRAKHPRIGTVAGANAEISEY